MWLIGTPGVWYLGELYGGGTAVEPEEPATGGGGGFGGGGGYVWTKPARGKRKRLAGTHQGFNWSTGALRASQEISGQATGRSAARSLHFSSLAEISGESQQRASATGVLRAITQPSKQTQRNAFALLGIIAARNRK